MDVGFNQVWEVVTQNLLSFGRSMCQILVDKLSSLLTCFR